MMGFTDQEVKTLLSHVAPKLKESEAVLNNLQKWYDGYLFSEIVDTHLYNPDMVLYFLKEFAYRNTYPRKLIDINIASDYGKIRRLFNLGTVEHNELILEELIENGVIEGVLTEQFSFEKEFTEDDFISMLFYLGFVTIKAMGISQLQYAFPNYVIKGLYFDLFMASIKEKHQLDFETVDVRKKLENMAQYNKVAPFVTLIEHALESLSNRDFMQFDEKYIKALFVGFASLSNLYFIKSEPEIEQKYPDIMFSRIKFSSKNFILEMYRPPFFPNYQFLIELKYLKKKERKKLEQIRKEAKTQIKGYLDFDEVKQLEHLKSWVIVFVGEKAEVVEEV